MDNYGRYLVSKMSAISIDSIFLYNLHSPKKSIVLFPQKQYFDNLYNFKFLVLVITLLMRISRLKTLGVLSSRCSS